MKLGGAVELYPLLVRPAHWLKMSDVLHYILLNFQLQVFSSKNGSA